MGNLSSTDRRFDKPALDALVDLLNYTNKSHIRYGEIDADQIVEIEPAEALPVNTKVRIRLKDAPVNAPSTTVAYRRLSLEEYVPTPVFFIFTDEMPTSVLFSQLREHHGVNLTPEDTEVTIGPADSEGIRTVTFLPRVDHFVWCAGLSVQAGPEDHLRRLIPATALEGFTRDQLAT